MANKKAPVASLYYRLKKYHYEKVFNDLHYSQSLEVNPHSKSAFKSSGFNLLPNLFNNLLGEIEDPEEKEFALFSLLCVCSGVFPNVKGYYSKFYIESNLYGFVNGNFGSGKGKMVHSLRLTSDIRKRFEKDFVEQMDLWKDLEDKDGVDPPVKKNLIVPANITKAAFIEWLLNNDARGIMFETEGGALTDALKQDYGNFYDILLRAFHHEPITSMRKGNIHAEISAPFLTVLLSGTEDQVSLLFRNITNGLLSRFMCYNLTAKSGFEDVFDKKNESRTDALYQRYSSAIAENYFQLKELEKPVLFELSDIQKKSFNQFFAKEREYFLFGLGEKGVGFLHRLALITFKIMMILTSTRNIGHLKPEKPLVCQDVDFFSAFEFYQVLRHHFLIFHQYLRNENKKKVRYDPKEVRKDALSLQSKGYSLRQISDALDIPKTTIARYLEG